MLTTCKLFETAKLTDGNTTAKGGCAFMLVRSHLVPGTEGTEVCCAPWPRTRWPRGALLTMGHQSRLVGGDAEQDTAVFPARLDLALRFVTA